MAKENDEVELLEKNVCHKKSKADYRNDENSNLYDFRSRKIKILLNNVRGFYSKRESFESILCRNKIDVAMITETFTTASRFPQLDGYTTYFRNRTERSAGGIAIMIRKELAKFVVKVYSGRLENEYMILKMTNCQPHLVLVIYYGTQTNTFSSDQVKLHLSELFQAIKKYKDEVCQINLCGDFNLNIGDSILPNNHPDSNVNGRLFLDQLQINGLTLMNYMSPDPVTFVDKSKPNHKRVCLDLVVTNKPGAVSGFVTDSDLNGHEFTPYSVRMRKKDAKRVYADHFAIMYEFETLWQERVKFKPDSIWNYKRRLGNTKFDIFTSNVMNYLLNKI